MSQALSGVMDLNESLSAMSQALSGVMDRNPSLSAIPQALSGLVDLSISVCNASSIVWCDGSESNLRLILFYNTTNVA